MRKFILFFFIVMIVAFASACNDKTTTKSPTMPHAKPSTQADRELIILAAPPSSDIYYQDQKPAIFEFHINYAKQILKHDDVIIFAGGKDYKAYVEALGKDHVIPYEMADIWMRDFSPLNATRPVMMRYTAAGQGSGRKGQSEADHVQEVLADVLGQSGYQFSESDLKNDGGNFVDDYAGNAVLSRKFLRDNKLTENQGFTQIRQITGAKNIAFIEADEQGGLEHADGVVAFIDENTLVINSYPEDHDYTAELKADLEYGLPGVKIHEIVTPYDGSVIYDKRFGSACGLYTNMLVTPRRIYFPQFGIPEDKEALVSMKRWTDKDIIPVMSTPICQMGGGVRCMSWQLRGPKADRLASFLRNR